MLSVCYVTSIYFITYLLYYQRFSGQRARNRLLTTTSIWHALRVIAGLRIPTWPKGCTHTSGSGVSGSGSIVRRRGSARVSVCVATRHTPLHLATPNADCTLLSHTLLWSQHRTRACVSRPSRPPPGISVAQIEMNRQRQHGPVQHGPVDSQPKAHSPRTAHVSRSQETDHNNPRRCAGLEWALPTVGSFQLSRSASSFPPSPAPRLP
mmetsp:Transcript_47453/g.106982  ORF Transcript_47453/g.106982 Transcript_47453/m.106982 type:complete len:208 (-) Transcript_47453:4-627(-)